MAIDKPQISLYIPQRAPFIMVDNLLDATPDRFVTDFVVLPDNIFLEDGHLREFGLIENIAQSSAAGIGFLNRSNASGPSDGFIGGISKLVLYDLPRAGDKLHTVVTTLQQFGNMYLLRGEIQTNGKSLITCEIKLAGQT